MNLRALRADPPQSNRRFAGYVARRVQRYPLRSHLFREIYRALPLIMHTDNYLVNDATGGWRRASRARWESARLSVVPLASRVVVGRSRCWLSPSAVSPRRRGSTHRFANAGVLRERIFSIASTLQWRRSSSFARPNTSVRSCPRLPNDSHSLLRSAHTTRLQTRVCSWRSTLSDWRSRGPLDQSASWNSLYSRSSRDTVRATARTLILNSRARVR